MVIIVPIHFEFDGFPPCCTKFLARCVGSIAWEGSGKETFALDESKLMISIDIKVECLYLRWVICI